MMQLILCAIPFRIDFGLNEIMLLPPDFQCGRQLIGRQMNYRRRGRL